MKTILRSKGLSCPSCIAKIEKSVQTVPGVKDVKVFFNTGRIEVEHETGTAGGQELEAAIRDAGYEAKVSPF